MSYEQPFLFYVSELQSTNRRERSPGSKAVVVDIISFLLVSVGSSTVQSHYSLGSRRACSCSESAFRHENGDRSVLLRVYCGQNDSMQKIFIRECSLFTVGSVCRVKRLTAG
jgi:hypothetical protein